MGREAASPPTSGRGSPNTAANPASSGAPGCPDAAPDGTAMAEASCTNPVSIHMFLRLLPPMPRYPRQELPILYPPRGSLRKIEPIGRLP
jgi:hypothetical protein